MERLKIHINQSVLEKLMKRKRIQRYIREEQKTGRHIRKDRESINGISS
jgi:hypothetical protein